jgi:hypothetical protein
MIVVPFHIGEQTRIKRIEEEPNLKFLMSGPLDRYLGALVTVVSLARPLAICCEHHFNFCGYPVRARDGREFTVDERLLQKCEQGDTVAVTVMLQPGLKQVNFSPEKAEVIKLDTFRH